LLEQMVRTMLDEINTKLQDAIITLHDIARLIEQEVGKGNLSDDIRNCANRVNVLIKERVENAVC
jgi:hypothetical protein